ncbi:hypothetical protein EXIGLDRAFT_776855 [Exidia glandulosa HHB12029]|uniref:Uncharacterized protein n=1 Tax=Exidia glandulosa HHB12029 TaxID=1314781 RepID=A0A165DBD3_EXIGL|nr:hypothetical protein EXIGLDRAFT_776855 [Exidia glandulosa HHB12029]
MPRLLVFKISANAQQETPVEIPASWTGDGAPELRILSLPAFSLPDVPQPFRNVTDFNATMKLCPDARRLFDYLPRIISLLLTDLAHDSLVPRGPVPISLEGLVFAAVLGTAIDYSHHLEPYETRPIRRSFLVSSLNLAPALRTFTKTHERPWSMSIKTSLVEMSTHDETYNDDNVHCSVVLASVGTTCIDWPLAWDRTGPYFDRLVNLNISLTALVNLMWINPYMPNLEFLVIGVRDAVDAKEAETPSRTFPPNSVCLTAFTLRAINMVVSLHEEDGDRPGIDRHCLRWFEVELPSLLRNCFDFFGPLEHLQYIELGVGTPSISGEEAE